MPDRIFVDEDIGIIVVESIGEISVDDINQSIAKIQEILNKKGISKVLVDASRQESLPSMIDSYDLFSTFPRDFMIAILVKEYQITEEELNFIETVAVNRAIRMQIFSERENALAWLDV